MRSKLYFFYIFLIIFGGSCGLKNTSDTSETFIYLIRHAEKDMNDTTDNPPLTAAGYARAEKLVEALSGVQPDVIYSTSYQRNINTVKLLAEKYDIEIQEYEWHDTEALSNTILEDHAGETVVVCGHSDNLLPLISKLGAEPPLDSLGSNEYGNIFKIEIGADGNAQITVSKY
jgi:2,3-bisphosphoglycerate-dependent phosphoglycerate mutase